VQALILAMQTSQGVADFLRTSFPATTPGFERLMPDFLDQPERLAHGPYLTIGLPFRRPLPGDQAFPWLSTDFKPHAHQARAFSHLTGANARSTLIATGTGSGKTECFAYPVLDYCREQRARGRRGIKAILVYPMNALATDQARRLAREILTRPALAAVTAGLYVGDEPTEKSTAVRHLGGDDYTLITDRERMREEPPDILLTNYKMLDFLLIRARDAELWRHNEPDTLRYLVVDELHSFDGAQGTDLACLIRRLKGRLRAGPGAVVCIGTSATFGGTGDGELVAFATQIFGEPFDDDAVIGEERETVAEYLAEASVEYLGMPQLRDYSRLTPLAFSSPETYIAAQYELWFGKVVTTAEVLSPAFCTGLGDALKQHVAFQNLLRDLHRQGGTAVPLTELVDAVARRLRDAGQAPADFVPLWLASLVALVAHAAKSYKENGDRIPFLTVRAELWLRELRRMVASLATVPELVHSDDLAASDKRLFLPVIHCRDCHAMGWGATLTRTDGRRLKSDLQAFYQAFFSQDLSTRFLFPAAMTQEPDAKRFERLPVCGTCGTVNVRETTTCTLCGDEALLPIDLARNERTGRRQGAPYTFVHHDCPYCDGDRTLTILGSQAASLASIAVGQLFGSQYNTDKKLIAFSDSVQDAAHRAGFFEARTWKLNLRPAAAQVIHQACESGTPLRLDELMAHVEARWLPALGEEDYIKTFLPPALAWLRDYERLLRENILPTDDYLRRLVRRGMTWALLAEFGQDAHVGRTLPRTGTATAVPDEHALDAATTRASAILREKVDSLRAVGEASVNLFLRGLVARLRRIGALWDEFLEAYARHGCNIFVYRHTNRAEFVLLRQPRRPHYLCLLPYGKCEAVTGPESAFYRDWAFKVFAELDQLALVDETVLADIYRIALEALDDAGITRALESERAGTRVWGIDPRALSLIDHTGEWRCARCHHVVIDRPGAPLEGTVCRQIGCRGHYVADPATNRDFYRQLYLSSDIRRIQAREHTGLLDRATREWTEGQFKAGHVNLLSATPTLEMGIDIGDLSAVLMCSVPPVQASYVQRSGRAGRATGNAFLATFAIGAPHDLYFWAAPREMIAGDIEAPGVFLNASAVLERQLTAFTLDCWVRELGQLARIPARLADLLSAVKNNTASKFPFPWLDYIALHRATLLEAFSQLFRLDATGLSAESEQYLERFITGQASEQGSLPWKIVNQLHGVNRDIDDLKNRRRRVDTEIARIEALPAAGDADREEQQALQQERAALTRLLASINQRDSLQFLTDEGLLPNYAFPEQGVLLQSIVVRDERRADATDTERVLTFEYERPGSSAITELAPNNVFYAEGRRVTIEQVDVARDQPEPWRFCRSCSYAEPAALTNTEVECPRCGDPLWSDAGRVQSMLRLTKVYARTLESQSRIGDDADDRERRFFVRQALIDVAPTSVREAWAIEHEELPFAFEFLERVRFREINFGEQTGDGEPMQIAGNDARKPGFLICPDCGTLQRRRKAEELWKNHALYCARRRRPDTAAAACVFLYREFDSEGIRLYLPESRFGGSEDCVHSFVAALQMGLELRFRGSVDHLRIARDIYIAQGQETPRQYLVIYDSVPGGTGYLKELMRDPQPLFEVFAMALEALNTCGCASDEAKDGCYRCLYGYHNRYEREHVSRRTATRLLTEILAHREQLSPIASISQVAPTNTLLDSELERRFIEALRRKPDDGALRLEVKEEVVRGKPGYAIRADEQRWLLEPQVDLGPDRGIVIPCRPDFILWPEAARDRLPIAVFVDGWKPHQDRIGDDIAKRMAVARSGRFQVWTVTYDDIALALGTTSERPETIWPSALLQSGEQAGPLYSRFGLNAAQQLHLDTAFENLRARLFATSDENAIRTSLILALRLGATPVQAQGFDQLRDTPALDELEALAVFAWPEQAELGRCWDAAEGAFQLAVQSRKADLAALPDNPFERRLQPCVVMRWADALGISDQDRKRLWQQWWQAANLLLPAANVWLCADHACTLAALADAPAYREVAADHGAWDEVRECAVETVQRYVAALIAAQVPPPLVGFELMDAVGRVVAEAELAWPEDKLALLLDADPDNQFAISGWTVHIVGAPDLPAAIIERYH